MQGRDLTFEIGTEELPSSAVYTAIQQLQVEAPKCLQDARLEYGAVAVVATPRRIALLVSQLAERQADATERHKGPATKAAFDEAGHPTKAAEGFARGKGVPVESLEVVEDESGSYVHAVVERIGVDALEVLPGLLARLAENIEWPKSMRWGSGDTRFSRPVRWLFAVFGTDVVPVEYAGLTAGRVTFGHRFLAPEPIEILGAYEYPTKLDQAMVVVDHDDRARLLREGIERVAAQYGGSAVVPEKTFAEVVNLVEWPTVTAGTFDEEFLAVPREMLEYAMGGHQRYFPLERSDGGLDNRFIVAHNGAPERTEAIVRGHERVIRARLADAAFFFNEDLKIPLEDWGARLCDVVFQEKLGTTAEKVERIERLAGRLAEMVGAPADEAAHATRAAHLAKADLVTNAVVEFTDLQGVMGRYYALASGESPEVAIAIEEHYRPRFAGDELPATLAAQLVSVADKMDTICGIFAAGMAPKGSADPFALRRSAIGVLQMALAGLALDLDALIGEALAGYEGLEMPGGVDAVGNAVKAFVMGRLEGILRDRGFAYDTIDAVLAAPFADPADALARCEALTNARERAPETFDDLSIAFKRAANLTPEGTAGQPDPALMGDRELALYKTLEEQGALANTLMMERAYSAVLETFAGMREPIDAFFDNVMVMDEDEALRANRLRLLAMFVGLFRDFADFGVLAG